MLFCPLSGFTIPAADSGNYADNLKPPGVANATGSLSLSGEYAQKESFELELGAEVHSTAPISVVTSGPM